MNSPRTVHDAARTEGLIKWVTAIAIVIGVDQAQWGDFACKAQPTGMTCWQQSTGKGFALNKAAHNSL